MTKHTQGPWHVYATPNDVDFSHEVNGVASIYISDYSEANARLIAAAPELLEALKRCQKQLQGLSFKDQDIVLAIERAYTAILKAEGANI